MENWSKNVRGNHVRVSYPLAVVAGTVIGQTIVEDHGSGATDT